MSHPPSSHDSGDSLSGNFAGQSAGDDAAPTPSLFSFSLRSPSTASASSFCVFSSSAAAASSYSSASPPVRELFNKYSPTASDLDTFRLIHSSIHSPDFSFSSPSLIPVCLSPSHLGFDPSFFYSFVPQDGRSVSVAARFLFCFKFFIFSFLYSFSLSQLQPKM
jgi:hypothetical protein